MDFIRKNIKKIGAFNFVLLFIASILCLMNLFNKQEMNILSKACDVFSIITVVFAVLYALNGYKKNASLYYRLFMLLYGITTLVSLIFDIYATVSYSVGFNPTNLIRPIIFVCGFMLAAGINLGRNVSCILAYAIVICEAVALIYTLAVYIGEFSTVSKAIMYFALACITCIFVIAKYDDKISRGSK